MPVEKRKRTSGPTVTEAVRAERGTGRVLSVRLPAAVIARLDAMRGPGESRADVLARLLEIVRPAAR